MKKIALSFATITAVASMAIGATGAYFTDQVNMTGNTMATGTIGINVDGSHDSKQGKYSFPDMKPGFVEDSNFTVTNTGNNPANITKKVVNINTTPGAVNLASVVDYALSVNVYENNILKWNQVLYNYDVTLASVQGNDMFLGMLPAGAGWKMDVAESYRMQTGAGNEYQGQTMTFDINVIAEQLKGTLVLEDKTGSNWDINQSSAQNGTLSYGVMDTKFNYTFNGVVPVANGNYTLVIGANPWDSGVALGSGVASGSNISLSGSVDLGTVTNQKVWLILSSHWNGTKMINWNQASYLFETGLIDYYQS